MNGTAKTLVEALAKFRSVALAALLAATLAALPACSGGEPTSGQSGRDAQDSAALHENALESQEQPSGEAAQEDPSSASAFDASQIPGYTGSPYTEVDGNIPSLQANDAKGVDEHYAPLDSFGRCGAAIAVVSPATMPTEERGDIGMVKPSGWHTVRYDDLVDGKYLYNRCHLIGYQLTGENANECNLITGTRYMNIDGMLPFENEVADYVDRTGGRVLYRSTPVFVGNELVARGVHLEALSLDDGGQGVSFNVFVYNVQPGIGIDYATGESWREEAAVAQEPEATPAAQEMTYVLNTNTGKFHYPECNSVDRMSEKNKQTVTATRDEIIAQGYEPCGNCNP